jgi:hypothetical protein
MRRNKHGIFVKCVLSMCILLSLPIFIWAEEYTEIARWEGKSIKNTETFTVPVKEWIIQWETKPGEYGEMNFQIFVYNSEDRLIGVAANVIGEGSDYSVMRGKGDFYLTINAAQPYVIKILVKE